MDSINYSAMDLKKRAQFGSDEKVSSNQKVEDFDYTDGLSKEELKRIDKNKDGAISEEEFKTAFGGSSADSYKSYWDSYKSFYNATSKKTSNGTQTTTTKDDGTVVKSSYDKDGNLEYYTETTVDDIGFKNTVKYKFIDGEEVALKQTTVNPNGTSQIKDLKTGSVTVKNVDGTYSKYDKNKNLVEIKTDAFGEKGEYSFVYDEDGKLKSAKVNGTTYTNITQKDKTVTIKDKDGNVVAKLSSDGSSNTYFAEYENGKKAKSVKMDSDGMPEYVVQYDEKGKSTSKLFCKNNQLREYERDAETGKLLSSTDTRDGKLYSKQTYSDKTQKDIYGDTRPSNTLWESRTYYDEDGNIKSYQTYDYQAKDEDGNVVRTINYYGADEKTLKKSVVTKLDQYANKVSSVTYDAKDVEQYRTFYEYDTERVRELPDTHLVSKTIEKQNQTTVEKYDYGVLTEKNVVTINNGVATSESYTYKYHTNGQVKQQEHTTADGLELVTEYDEQGNETSNKIDLYTLIKSQYPDLSTKQLKQLLRKCVSVNDLSDSHALVNYNNGKFDITIPEFEKGSGNWLEFK